MELASLSLVPLDRERTWYRYHHLFRGLLERKLCSESGEKLVASLHARASDWLTGEGLVEGVLHHALTAGDAPKADRLVEQHRHALHNREDRRTTVRWWMSPPR